MISFVVRCVTCYSAAFLSMATCAITYTPPDQEKELNGFVKLSVDCLAVDCEDEVGINKKLLSGPFRTSYS
jgi:hypothetical protein